MFSTSTRVLCVCILGWGVTAATVAQERLPPRDGQDVTMKVSSNLVVGPGEKVGTAVVLNGDAAIDGEVENALVVVGGNARVNGVVKGDITVVNGALDLGDGAAVQNVKLVHSTLHRAAGASMAGTLEESQGAQVAAPWRVFSAASWFGWTLLLLLAGALLAAVGPRQLRRAGELALTQPVAAFGASFVMWMVIPLSAVLLMFTIVAIPLGLSILFIGLPLLVFGGHLVGGYVVGKVIFEATQPGSEPAVPQREILAGVLVVQLLGLIPFLGGLLGFGVLMMGTGGLLLLGWEAYNRGRPGRTEHNAMPHPA